MWALEEGKQGSEVVRAGVLLWWGGWLYSPWVLEVHVVPGVLEVH